MADGIKKLYINQLGVEDILLGEGTVTQTRGGQSVTLTMINAKNLPYDADHTLEEKILLLEAAYPNITIVADNITDVNIVAANIDDVKEVAEYADELSIIIINMDNINIVADNIDSVNSVGLNIDNINAVNANEVNINAVNTNKTNIDAVALNEANITSVADNEANINVVNTNEANINAVNANEANINAAVANEANINAAPAAATAAQLSKWEAEAEALNSRSDASEAEDIFVKDYTSVGDGTFIVVNTTRYSALHWEAKAAATSGDVLLRTNNLSDVDDSDQALINLNVTDATITLTNKTLTNLSNYIHANGTHYQVKHIDGGVFAKGTPVKIVGWETDTLRIAKASNVDFAIGLLGQDLDNGVVGGVLLGGVLQNIDTDSWEEGDTIYTSAVAGVLTNVAASENNQPVGKVIRKHATEGVIGILGLNKMDGTTISAAQKLELEKLIAIQNDSLEPTGYNREDIAATFGVLEFCESAVSGNYRRIDGLGAHTDITGATTYGDGVTPLADYTVCLRPDTARGLTSYKYWEKGIQYVITNSATLQFDITEGKQICVSKLGVLSLETVVHDAIIDDVLHCIVYCDGKGNYPLFADERHGNAMNGIDHLRVHTTIGCVYEEGMDIEGLVDAGEVYTQTTSGAAWDEDIRITPAQQAVHPFMYRGVDGEWIWSTADNRIAYSLSRDNTTDTLWNRDNGDGTWGLVLSEGSTDYIPYHFVLTNDGKYHIAKIVGQAAYASRSAARDAIESEIRKLKLGGLPSPEFIFLYSIIIKRDTTLEDLSDGSTFVDFRESNGGGSGTTSTTATYHPDLLDRDVVDAHPISAITGLTEELGTKLNLAQVQAVSLYW